MSSSPSDAAREAWLDSRGLEAWRSMAVIRALEERLPELARAGLVPGSTHPAVGMEAVAVGVSLILAAADVITSNHRGHAHCLARGADPGRVLAEILGRSDGYCGGKGGSMHLASRELGIYGANGIVGAGIGLATGVALASQIRRDGAVAVAYFGDGATNQGIFHESLNLASIWRLPAVYVCENNHYAQSSRIEEMTAIPDLAARARSYGIPGVGVDGMDVAAVAAVARSAVERARAGQGPTLLVADTYRYLGHMVGDTEIYRSAEEVAGWRARDPITRLEEELSALGVLDTVRLAAEREGVRQRIVAAERFALNSPPALAGEALAGVYGSAGG